VELAEEVGGVLDNTAVVCHGPSILGVQDVGIPTCTLGQVRHRADLIIYWGCDPWSAHPRHLERYTSFTDGRFEDSEWKSYLNKVKAAAGRKKLRSLERKGILKERHPHIAPTVSDNKPPEILNKKGRKLIVVDVRKSMTAEIADYFLQVEYGKDYELIQAVRALVRDQELDVEKVAGVPVEYLQQLADAMISCEFGVIFFGMGLTQSAGKFRNIDVAISLVRDLNMRTKFVILPMRGHFNVTGANTVFTWQSGYPYGVDFSIGYPRYNPGETTVVDILMREESDAGLVIASDPVSNFPRRAVEHLVKNPLIVIDPHMNATSLVGDIIFPSSIVGIEKIKNGFVFDPLNGIKGEKMDIAISNGTIVKSVIEKTSKIIDATGLTVFPGGVDIHTHIAGAEVNTGRMVRPEDHEKDFVRKTAITRSGVGYSIPSTFTTGYRYSRMGYTTVMNPSMAPLEAKHTHEELNDIPMVDKATYPLLGDWWLVLENLAKGDFKECARYVAWMLGITKGYAIKIVNPGGLESWGFGRNVHSIDDQVPNFGITPREIMCGLAKVNKMLNMPHAIHLHTNNLGIPGNYNTTLETMKCFK